MFKLFQDAAPNACDNFLCLCDGSKGKAKGSGQPLHYQSVPFHRIVPGKIVQGGDFAMKNGTGGESIWGGTFKDEKGGLKLKHSKRGVPDPKPPSNPLNQSSEGAVDVQLGQEFEWIPGASMIVVMTPLCATWECGAFLILILFPSLCSMISHADAYGSFSLPLTRCQA